MGMTDRQFDSYTENQIEILEQILENSKDYAQLKEALEKFINKRKAQLKRP